tara:strand:+ start:1172 stop:1690 length:519 start_codon:yes stop_codon:yes gene_type:complete
MNTTYGDLDDIRFEEIFEYDKSQLIDDAGETEYEDNQYYIGIATQVYNSNFDYENYWLFASNINISTFYRFPFQDIKTYMNNYRVIGPKYLMIQPDIIKMHYINSGFNSPLYTVIKKTFWLRLVQRTWKKIYKAKRDFINKNLMTILHQRQLGKKIKFPTYSGMLSYLKDNK